MLQSQLRPPEEGPAGLPIRRVASCSGNQAGPEGVGRARRTTVADMGQHAHQRMGAGGAHGCLLCVRGHAAPRARDGEPLQSSHFTLKPWLILPTLNSTVVWRQSDRMQPGPQALPSMRERRADLTELHVVTDAGGSRNTLHPLSIVPLGVSAQGAEMEPGNVAADAAGPVSRQHAVIISTSSAGVGVGVGVGGEDAGPRRDAWTTSAKNPAPLLLLSTQMRLTKYIFSFEN